MIDSKNSSNINTSNLYEVNANTWFGDMNFDLILSSFGKKNIDNYINDPMTYHNELNALIEVMRNTSGIFTQTIAKMVAAPSLGYTITPTKANKKNVEKRKIANNLLEELNHTLITRDSLDSHLTYGESVFILQQNINNNEYMLKPLHRDFVRFEGSTKGDHIVSFDMDYFTSQEAQIDEYTYLEPTEILKTFPKEFTIAYNLLVDLLSTSLKIGNKPLKVEIKCQECGKVFKIHMCKFISKYNVFCSQQCYAISKTHDDRIRGKNNIRYSSEKINCTNCQKEMSLPKHRRSNINSFGDSHCFCSHPCYWEYRKKYYTGTKNNMTGKVLSDKAKDDIRQYTLKMYASGKFDTDTKPQIAVNSMLDDLSVKFVREKIFKYYSVDNYLPDYNLIIEVMGDYFHANPTIFAPDKLNQIQQKGITRDKRKRTYIKKYYSIDILYLWEYDIKHQPDICKWLIKNYIKNNGVLHDYHSYNYS